MLYLLGADSSDFVKYVDHYYDPSAEGLHNSSLDYGGGHATSESYKPDRQLHQISWTWLVQHPEIRVGKKGEGNALSLSEVEKFNRRPKFQKHAGDAVPPVTPSVADAPMQDPPDTECLSAIENAPSPNEASKAKQERPKKQIPKHAAPPPSYRLYTSETRMWHALTGHGPDIKRIPPMQFACLSIIATRRQHGILQAELTRISNQDKRSVPHRTDQLAKNGYIEKRVILSQKTKTSILYAKRFAPQSAFLPQVSIDNQRTAQEGARRGGETIDYLSMFNDIMKLLKESKIMSLVDVKTKLVATKISLLRAIANGS